MAQFTRKQIDLDPALPELSPEAVRTIEKAPLDGYLLLESGNIARVRSLKTLLALRKSPEIASFSARLSPDAVEISYERKGGGRGRFRIGQAFGLVEKRCKRCDNCQTGHFCERSKHVRPEIVGALA